MSSVAGGAEEAVGTARNYGSSPVAHRSTIPSKLRSVGEAVRAIGNAKACRVGVESLATREFTGLQLMQIIGDRQVKIVPEVQATGGGTGAGGGLVEAFIGLLAQKQTAQLTTPTSIPPTVSPRPGVPGAASDSAT